MDRKNQYKVIVRIDPRGKPFDARQEFRIKAPDVKGAKTELDSCFRIYANHHGWGYTFDIIAIKLMSDEDTHSQFTHQRIAKKKKQIA